MSARLPRIGTIVPSGNVVVETDLNTCFRGTATVHATRLDAGSLCTADAHRSMNASLDEAARLIGAVHPDAVAYACTSGGFELGLAGDSEIVARIGALSEAPAQSATGAIVAALRTIRARRIAIVSPYLPSLTAQLANVLAESGFAVVASASAGLTRNDDISAQTPADIAAFVLAHAPADVDAIVLPCTNWRAAEAIGAIEDLMAATVVTSNSALAAGFATTGIPLASS